MKLLDEILEINKEQQIFVGRELTKMFEDIKVDTVEDIKKYYENNSAKLKGEFVIVPVDGVVIVTKFIAGLFCVLLAKIIEDPT
jgi:16S rRNA C1402 (ribose-2'-O) methylase RsmI